MSTEDTDRRSLLKIAGVGTAGVLLPAINAKTQSGSAHRGRIFDTRLFGAIGNGRANDTAAINRTIEAAAAVGGGAVIFSAGDYLSHSIHLKSNIALVLQAGARIIAADPPGYDLAEPKTPWDKYQDFGHNHWHNSLIWGEGLENVMIAGPGLIWGRGLNPGYRGAEEPGVGNKSISLKNCRNVILRDFAILHGGHFGILATGVDNLTLDNLKIDTNRDGMDIDCCRNVRISNCSVNSPGDDAICLKSSYALGEVRFTDMVMITNCLVSGSFREGTLLDGTFQRFPEGFDVAQTGRIKFGTETNGGFRNITIANCAFDGCQGLALECVDGGLLEDVTITNISMRDIVSAPIFVRLGSRMRGPEGRPVGKLQRVLISNVVCHNAGSRISSIISGVSERAIEDMQIHDIYIEHQGGGTRENASIRPPEHEKSRYPEPARLGTMPSHGFFIRHVKNIEMSNVEIRPTKDDFRPTFVLDDVQGAEFFRIRTPRIEGVPMFALNNVTDFSVARAKLVADTELDRVDSIAIP